MRRCSSMFVVLFVLRFVMAHSSEQVELSCRFRVPTASRYAHLLRYLKAHPYKSVHTFLLDAAGAFYLPHALIEVAASPEVLQAAGEQSTSALLAQATLITVHLNACLPLEYKLQTPLNLWRTLGTSNSSDEVSAPASNIDSLNNIATPMMNPFNFADCNSLK